MITRIKVFNQDNQVRATFTQEGVIGELVFIASMCRCYVDFQHLARPDGLYLVDIMMEGVQINNALVYKSEVFELMARSEHGESNFNDIE